MCLQEGILETPVSPDVIFRWFSDTGVIFLETVALWAGYPKLILHDPVHMNTFHLACSHENFSF